MSTVDPEAIAARVAGCPGVAELSGGPTGTVATYLPGRKIVGVRIQDSTVTVHVVGRWDVPIPAMADEIRASVSSLVGRRDIAIVVDDLRGPGDATTGPTATP